VKTLSDQEAKSTPETTATLTRDKKGKPQGLVVTMKVDPGVLSSDPRIQAAGGMSSFQPFVHVPTRDANGATVWKDVILNPVNTPGSKVDTYRATLDPKDVDLTRALDKSKAGGVAFGVDIAAKADANLELWTQAPQDNTPVVNTAQADESVNVFTNPSSNLLNGNSILRVGVDPSLGVTGVTARIPFVDDAGKVQFRSVDLVDSTGLGGRDGKFDAVATIDPKNARQLKLIKQLGISYEAKTSAGETLKLPTQRAITIS
jgi:hypothetical protein